MVTWAALAAGLSASGLVFLVGCRLLRHYWPPPPPAPEAAGSWGVGHERRRWPRRPGNPVPVLVRDAIQAKPSHGVVVNRAEGGVALLVDRRYEPGTLLSVRPPEALDDIPWLAVEVKHGRKAGRQWLVGCQFVEAPPWNAWVWLG